MKLVGFKGIYLENKKLTAGVDLTHVVPTDFYNVPLKVGKIQESEPCVQSGDLVKQGSIIAKPAGKFGLNIFSPVSGKVLNIYSKMNSNGDICKHILIMNDKKYEAQDLPKIESIGEKVLVERLKEAGMIDTISSMPTYLKYAFVGSRSYKTLLVLADSTDPNNTVNQTITQYRTEELVNGAKYFMNITGANFITFVFNDQNREVAYKLKKHIEETKKNYDFKIKFIPNKYPFDDPYILTNLVTGKKINKKQSFLDAGITIETAEACFNFCRAVEFNKPVTSKIITVDGDSIERIGNYIVPNGMSYEKFFDFVGTKNSDDKNILINGNVLSGKAQFNKDISVSLDTQTLVFMKYDEFSSNKEYPCISCGKCAAVCPVFLNPKRLEKAYLEEDYDMLHGLKVSSCIECGLCSYVCPAKRFLTQRITVAKHTHKKNKGGA